MEGHKGFERCSSVKTTSKDMRRRPNVPKEIPGSLDAILFCKYVYIHCIKLFMFVFVVMLNCKRQNLWTHANGVSVQPWTTV